MREEQITGGGRELLNYSRRNEMNNIVAELKDYGFKGENEMEEIKIRKVLNGYIVRVGCETVVFQRVGDLCGELKRYLENPDLITKEYMLTFRPEPEEKQDNG